MSSVNNTVGSILRNAPSHTQEASWWKCDFRITTQRRSTNDDNLHAMHGVEDACYNRHRQCDR